MTRDPETVRPGDSCRELLRAMHAGCFRHAPVVDGGRLVGVVSERDVLARLSLTVGDAERDVAVREVMVSEPISCSPNDALDVVAATLQRRRIGCLPVVSGEALVGIVTVNDLLRGFTDHLAADGARRLQLLWSAGDRSPMPDVLALCAREGARVVAYLTSHTDTGARMVLLRVIADEASFAALVEECVSAGLLRVGARAAA